MPRKKIIQPPPIKRGPGRPPKYVQAAYAMAAKRGPKPGKRAAVMDSQLEMLIALNGRVHDLLKEQRAFNDLMRRGLGLEPMKPETSRPAIAPAMTDREIAARQPAPPPHADDYQDPEPEAYQPDQGGDVEHSAA